MSAYTIRKNEDGAFVVVHDYEGPVAVFPTDAEAVAYVLQAEGLPAKPEKGEK